MPINVGTTESVVPFSTTLPPYQERYFNQAVQVLDDQALQARTPKEAMLAALGVSGSRDGDVVGVVYDDQAKAFRAGIVRTEDGGRIGTYSAGYMDPHPNLVGMTSTHWDQPMVAGRTPNGLYAALNPIDLATATDADLPRMGAYTRSEQVGMAAQDVGSGLAARWHAAGPVARGVAILAVAAPLAMAASVAIAVSDDS